MTLIFFVLKDSCLYKELTVRENFFYFGKLYRMTPKSIKAREKFLMQLLDLPSNKALVGTLRYESLLIILLLK